jgi:hypothetical protein
LFPQHVVGRALGAAGELDVGGAEDGGAGAAAGRIWASEAPIESARLLVKLHWWRPLAKAGEKAESAGSVLALNSSRSVKPSPSVSAVPSLVRS